MKRKLPEKTTYSGIRYSVKPFSLFLNQGTIISTKAVDQVFLSSNISILITVYLILDILFNLFFQDHLQTFQKLFKTWI